ncbi:MAG TPA: ABC transporter permease [Vicinamibacterales bacterium]|jgi:predicted permease|nr:ABC transporter permease [Vicinamibacterales bacterium]
MLADGLSDARYAARWLVRSPGFALVAVLSLAVGIALNTTLFALIDALLLRPLSVSRPDRLVSVYTRGGGGDKYSTTSYPDYVDLRARNDVFSDLVGFSPAIAALKAGDRSRMALGEVVTGNYFQVLGISAALGRTILPDDDRRGAPRVVVVSHRFWQHEYGGDRSVLGRTLLIHGQPYLIVGVAPAAFTGLVPMLQPELWLPVAWVDEVEPAGIQDAVPSPGDSRIERRGQRWLFLKGRLKEGATPASAEANLQVIMSQLATAFPKTNEGRPVATAVNVRIHPDADGRLRLVAGGLMVAIALVLLIACANVANMLLARGSARRKEIGIRLAIGASRARLIRLLLTESIVLASLGAVGGALLAAWALRLLATAPLPIPIPLALNFGVDGRVLLFTTLIAAAAGVAAGLAPALRATRIDLSSDMKGDAPAGKGRWRWSLRDGLVVLQTAVTLVLLVAAGLLTRSILKAQDITLGFRTDGVVALSAELSLVGYDDARATRLYEAAADRVRGMPGVVSVSRAVRQPLSINYTNNTIFFPERAAALPRGTSIGATWVDEHYFATLGIPLLRGRNFDRGDTASARRVAIVNEAFVHRYWPGEDGLGRHFRRLGPDGPEYEVVGVSGDYKVQSVGEHPTPYIHYALAQRAFTGNVFIARTSSDAGALLAAMRRELLALEPNMIFFESHTMNAQVDAALLPARVAAQTLSLVGLVATLLAAVGLYGVIAYAVGRRTREIGIRLALGAAPRQVLGMIMRQGLGLAGVGVAAGLLFSWIAAKAIASGLYGVGAWDPAAWGSAVGVLLGSAALANFVPARRAARVDPSTALRTQ